MVTITRENLKSTIPEFLRDVYRNLLTNPTSNSGDWIYKDNPQLDWTQAKYPIVIISVENIEKVRLGMRGNRYRVGDINVTVSIYTDDPYDRDTISDEIDQFTLAETTSADADGDTFEDNRLRVKTTSYKVDDKYIDQEEILRVGIVSITLRYYGG